MMYTNTSIMEENASTWIVSLFAKLFILAKHKGGEWSPLFICLYAWSHFCSAHTNQIICKPPIYSFDVEFFKNTFANTMFPCFLLFPVFKCSSVSSWFPLWMPHLVSDLLFSI